MTAATDALDRLVALAVARGDAPGVVAGFAIGDTVHVASAGSMSVDGPDMRRDTLFRISSMTKPITAAAVLRLVDDGVLGIDQPVDELLPELADRRVLREPSGPLTDTVPADRPITVRDLLTFTWGFGMQGAMFTAARPWPIVVAAHDRDLHTFGPTQPDLMPDPDTWLARLGELPLLAQPGERWLYQSGSQVLGVLAARACGGSFADAVHAVTEPIGMVDTEFHASEINRLATAYESHDGRLTVSDPPDGQWAKPPAFPDGSGGLVSTVDDMLAFGRMLLRGGDPVLRTETVAAMTTDQLTPAQRERVWPGFSFLDDRGWGYGVSVLDDGSYTWEGGFGSTWRNVPSHNVSVVVLTQRAANETGMPSVCVDAVPTILAAL